jgi:Putative adhesin
MPQSALWSLPPRLRVTKPRYGEARRSWSSDSHRQAKAAALAAGVCAAGILSACDVTIKDGDITNVSIRHKVSEQWSRRYPLAEGGTVEIVNAVGPIEVAVGAAGAVDVAAVLQAGAMTEVRAKEILSEISLEESVKPDRVRVATTRRRGRGGFDVSIKVTMPANARLEMTGNDGLLKAEGLEGHVKAMVVNGGIELAAMRGTIDAAGVNASVTAKMADVTGPLRLESTNGRIALELPKTAKATLNARSVNGNIVVTGLTVEEGTGRRIRTLESPLNGGGPEIDLRVTNGRISITGVESQTSLPDPPSPPTPPSPPRPPR